MLYGPCELFVFEGMYFGSTGRSSCPKTTCMAVLLGRAMVIIFPPPGASVKSRQIASGSLAALSNSAGWQRQKPDHQNLVCHLYFSLQRIRMDLCHIHSSKWCPRRASLPQIQNLKQIWQTALDLDVQSIYEIAEPTALLRSCCKLTGSSCQA